MPQAVLGIQLDLGRFTHHGIYAFGHAAQLRSHLLTGAVFHQHTGEFFLHALGFFALGQQKIRLHLHQTGGHLDKFACTLHLVNRQAVYHRNVLVDQGHNLDVINIHFVFGDEVQQQVQRPLKIFQLKSNRLFHPAG